MKKAVVSVSNDLITDQRVQRSIGVLQELGYEVCFVGRKLPGSLPFSPPYETRRFRLWFQKGFLFYATFNLRLFLFLLFRRFDLYLSNDLDTLAPNFLASRIWRKPLVYDSHEYFTGVPEIQQRPAVKAIWTGMERLIFPRLKYVITVNESIARLYQRDYGIKPRVVRNIADSYLPEDKLSRQQLALPQSQFLVLNQGSGINVDRGMEEMLEALELLPQDISLLVVGKGDVLPQLKARANHNPALRHRVIFIPPKPYRQMLQYTLQADVGLSLDKDTNINYRYSLPNKVFDYIKCGVPLVCSRVLEVKALVDQYGIGELSSHNPEELAAAILNVKQRGRAHYQENLAQAARENNWEKERTILKDLFLSIE